MKKNTAASITIFSASAIFFGCASTAPAPPEIAETPTTQAEAPEAMRVPIKPPTPIERELQATERAPEPEIVNRVPGAGQVLAAALEAYESSTEFLRQGDADDAIAAIDEAYSLMTSVEADADPILAQEKDDLRRLVSRRLAEIYGSRRSSREDLAREIPLEINPEVEREVRSFQGPEREFFLQSYQRSGLYRPMILEALRDAGMPEQLSWLPLVESGFKVRALSRAQALGLWQFIASTGYRYELRRTDFIDERMDPTKATRAALAYLSDLHGMFGDWNLALAGYNSGERRVQRQIESQSEGYFDQVWDLIGALPSETRRYVPRFLATLLIVDNPSEYGFELPQPLAPLQWETVEIERSVAMTEIAKTIDVDVETLNELNPELRYRATPPTAYALRVPDGTADRLSTKLAELPRWSTTESLTVHRVRSGETLSNIAGRYRTSVSDIMRLNNLRSANRIYPGQQLRIRGADPSPSTPTTTLASDARYRVRAGDSLWIVANRFGTSVDSLRRDNGLRSTVLHPGQELLVKASASGDSRGSGSGSSYTVRRGDTLSAIARRLRVSLDALLGANGLNSRSTIYPGQTLIKP